MELLCFFFSLGMGTGGCGLGTAAWGTGTGISGLGSRLPTARGLPFVFTLGLSLDVCSFEP